MSSRVPKNQSKPFLKTFFSSSSTFFSGIFISDVSSGSTTVLELAQIIFDWSKYLKPPNFIIYETRPNINKPKTKTTTLLRPCICDAKYNIKSPAAEANISNIICHLSSAQNFQTGAFHSPSPNTGISRRQ